uniref:GED domain-containing protein n=1 Tax=Caenorhabditis tropicalis TaxID=1561998 RepID=A0A1I7USN8_9PELO
MPLKRLFPDLCSTIPETPGYCVETVPITTDALNAALAKEIISKQRAVDKVKELQMALQESRMAERLMSQKLAIEDVVRI